MLLCVPDAGDSLRQGGIEGFGLFSTAVFQGTDLPVGGFQSGGVLGK